MFISTYLQWLSNTATPCCVSVFTAAFDGSSSLKRPDPRLSMRSSRCSSYDVGSRMRARRNVAKMLIVVVVIFAVCYLPVHLLNICRYVDEDSHQKLARALRVDEHSRHHW
jgi:hypothetical protein